MSDKLNRGIYFFFKGGGGFVLVVKPLQVVMEIPFLDIFSKCMQLPYEAIMRPNTHCYLSIGEIW